MQLLILIFNIKMFFYGSLVFAQVQVAANTFVPSTNPKSLFGLVNYIFLVKYHVTIWMLLLHIHFHKEYFV